MTVNTDLLPHVTAEKNDYKYKSKIINTNNYKNEIKTQKSVRLRPDGCPFWHGFGPKMIRKLGLQNTYDSL